MKRQIEPWGSMDWLIDDALQPGAGLSLARMTLVQGATSPGHRHPNCNEAIHVASGAVELILDGRSTPLADGDTGFIPAGTAHSLRNVGTGDAVMFVCYSAGSRVYEPTA